jgi:formylglycine-generating enzyme required for sulfatase activity
MNQKKCCSPQRNEIGDQVKFTHNIKFIKSHKTNNNAMVLIEGGIFSMGTDDPSAFMSDGEGPTRLVEVDQFYFDKYPVTNLEFDKFCQNTGYITEAEKFQWSFVFHLLVSKQTKKNVSESVSSAPWWLKVEKAYWRSPYGPDSNIEDLEHHPVVHISWYDAVAYSKWASKSLPTEAEWEMATRGGLDNKLFSWGDNDNNLHEKCNIWQGQFPKKNTMQDGWLATSPVNTFDPNEFGVYDALGNVWEWCSDWFSPSFHQIERSVTRKNPKGPNHGNTKIMKGGSYLCHDSYCNRYRIAARTQSTPDSSTGNLGFRTMYRK